MRACSAVLFLLVLWSCTSIRDGYDEAFAAAVPACAVVNDPTKYDGQTLTIHVRFRQTPHGGALLGIPPCVTADFQYRRAANYTVNERADAALAALVRRNLSWPVDVVYRATFRVISLEPRRVCSEGKCTYVGPPLQCTAVTCSLRVLEIGELIAVRPGY